jgi:hypothetical protein
MTDPENICIAVETALISTLQAEIGALPVYGDAILDFRLAVTCDGLCIVTFQLADSEKIGTAVESALITSLQAETGVLTV